MRFRLCLIFFSAGMLFSSPLNAQCPFATVFIRGRIEGGLRPGDSVVALLTLDLKAASAQDTLVLAKPEFVFNLRYSTLSWQSPVGGALSLPARCNARPRSASVRLVRQDQTLDAVEIGRTDLADEFGVLRNKTPLVLRVPSAP
jgi:hypothetical protein